MTQPIAGGLIARFERAGIWYDVPTPHPLAVTMRLAERNELLNALAYTDGNVQRAAAALGIPRSTFITKMAAADVPHDVRPKGRRAKTIGALLIAGLLSAGVATAQVGPDTATRDTLRLDTPGARKAADIVSTILVVTSLALPCLRTRTWRCAANEGLQVGTGVASAEVLKRVVHRTRPDGSDNKSWFSEHTLLACLGDLNSHVWAICPAVGLLRIEADKHYATDVGTGVAVAVGIHTTVHWGK